MADTASREELELRARKQGIQPFYHDIWGTPHRVSDASLESLIATMQHATPPHGPEHAPRPAIVLPVHHKEVSLPLPVTPTHTDASPLTAKIILEGGKTVDTAVHVVEPWQPGELDPAYFTSPTIPNKGLQISWDSELPHGYHRLWLRGHHDSVDTSFDVPLIATPTRCFEPAPLASGARVWGMAIQLYALRSDENWGIGDFTDLGDLVEQLAPMGVDLVGLNPLHALFTTNPAHCSPYSPSTRLFVNPLYIDVQAVINAQQSATVRAELSADEFHTMLTEARAGDLIDYVAVSRLKHRYLRACFEDFRTRLAPIGSALHDDFAAFQDEVGSLLREHALFEAVQSRAAENNPEEASWSQWDPAFQNRNSPEVEQVATDHEEEVVYHMYLQWWADRQLKQAQQRALDAGMKVGIYRDLAVGSDRGGSDTWASPDLYAASVSVGAPPDDFNLKGQDWGLPPMKPTALTASGYAGFVAAVRQNMRHAGALRIDHAMGLFRLFWIPPTSAAADGAYVHYPADAMFGIVALESHRQQCVVIGEDLGTVPDEVRHLMHRYGAYSYRLLWFERDEDGELKAPNQMPRRATVAAATHDIATLVGYWSGYDIHLRASLNMFADVDQEHAQRHQRYEDQKRLLRALQREGLLPEGVDPESPPGELSNELRCAAHAYLGRSNAAVLMVQMEDVLGIREQVNLPGTVDEHPNWRRRQPLAVSGWAKHPSLLKVAEALRRERKPHP